MTQNSSRRAAMVLHPDAGAAYGARASPSIRSNSRCRVGSYAKLC